MAQTDLFKTKKEELLEWLMQVKWARTSDVCAWGVKKYSPDRATRNARELRAEGKIFRMRDELKNFYFCNTKEDVYTVNQSES